MNEKRWSVNGENKDIAEEVNLGLINGYVSPQPLRWVRYVSLLRS